MAWIITLTPTHLLIGKYELFLGHRNDMFPITDLGMFRFDFMSRGKNMHLILSHVILKPTGENERLSLSYQKTETSLGDHSTKCRNGHLAECSCQNIQICYIYWVQMQGTHPSTIPDWKPTISYFTDRKSNRKNRNYRNLQGSG